VTTSELRRLLDEVDDRTPGVRLVVNAVGNLALLDGDTFVGFIDFGDKSVTVINDDE
jgi:hypothetical protein